jgi:hypothetical protein
MDKGWEMNENVEESAKKCKRKLKKSIKVEH